MNEEEYISLLADPVVETPAENVIEERIEETPVVVETPAENVVAEKKEETVVEEDFKWEDDTAKKIYESLVSGDYKTISDITYEQSLLRSVDTLSPEQVIKLKIAYESPELTEEEINDEFQSRFGIEDDGVDRDLLTEEEISALDRKNAAQQKKVDRELKKESKTAKEYLATLRKDIAFPDLLKKANESKPESIIENYLKDSTEKQVEVEKVEREKYLATINDGLNGFNGFETKYADEEVSFDGKYSPTSEEKTALADKMKTFTLADYFGERYFQDGKYVSNKIAEDIYLLENKDKIISSLVTQAVSKAKLDIIKSMKNVDFSATPRSAASASTKDEYDKAMDVLYR